MKTLPQLSWIQVKSKWVDPDIWVWSFSIWQNISCEFTTNIFTIIIFFKNIFRYHFHYGIMVPTFHAENLKLLTTDTDSLCYEITQKQNKPYIDVWEKLSKTKDNLMVKQYFYFNHPFYFNNFCLGIFKFSNRP